MLRLISVGALILLAMLTLNFRVAIGQNDAKTYRCAAKDVVSLQDNGTGSQGERRKILGTLEMTGGGM